MLISIYHVKKFSIRTYQCHSDMILMDAVTADNNIILCQYVMTSSLSLFLAQLIRNELSINLSVRKPQCE